MNWIQNDELVYSLNLTNNKVAGFDIDWTIIKPKSGYKFPRGSDDWCFLFNNIKSILIELSKDYSIVFFSNQSRFKDELIHKFNNIQKELNIPITFLISIDRTIYRKPMIGMWDFLLENKNNINLKDSFYCGDAAGRKKDFACSDLYFATNNKLKFYTPEEYFLGKQKDYVIKNHNFNKYLTTKYKIPKFKNNNKNIVILVGYPGSGKSYFSNILKYSIISQDILKTHQKCLKETEKYMILENNIVIDNTNYQIKNRRDYQKLGKKYGYYIILIQFTNSIDFCKHMDYYRVSNNEKKKLISNVVYNKITKYMDDINENEGDEIIHLEHKLDIYTINQSIFNFNFI